MNMFKFLLACIGVTLVGCTPYYPLQVATPTARFYNYSGVVGPGYLYPMGDYYYLNRYYYPFSHCYNFDQCYYLGQYYY